MWTYAKKNNIIIRKTLDFTDNFESIRVHLFYYNELIPKTYVDPDKLQFSKELLITEHPIIYDAYYNLPYDSYRNESERERKLNYNGVIMLDPDIYVDGINNTDETEETNKSDNSTNDRENISGENFSDNGTENVESVILCVF